MSVAVKRFSRRSDVRSSLSPPTSRRMRRNLWVGFSRAFPIFLSIRFFPVVAFFNFHHFFAMTTSHKLKTQSSTRDKPQATQAITWAVFPAFFSEFFIHKFFKCTKLTLSVWSSRINVLVVPYIQYFGLHDGFATYTFEGI